MTKTKSTKRALLMSALALLMCVSMLIGSTFAWFTDSVTSGSNIIKSGTLDVALVDAEGKSLEDEMIEWAAKDGRAQNEILWEPGCTYNTEEFYIENKGNLNLKFKFAVTGIDGDAKLLEVIDFSVMADASQMHFNTGAVSVGTSGTFDLLKGYEVDTLFYGVQNFNEYVLEPGDKVGPLVLSGHMDENAGNEYQNLTIEGIAVSIIATQATGEEDSFDGTYDEDATYPVTNASELAEALANGGNVVLANDIVMNNSINLSNADFVLDGRGHTITMADDATNTYALFDITGGQATIKNVTFDGIRDGAIVRTVHAEFNADNVTAMNGNHTQINGLFRLLGKSTVTNCTFKNNICNMVISLNWDGANEDPQVVKNCVFENNTCNATAVVYYVKGASATIDGNKFVGNNVTVTGTHNAATLYMGFQENATITNNVFENNTVNGGTSERVAGAIMIGYDAVITGNSFVGNRVTGVNAIANDVAAAAFYTDIDLSGNYWGGSAPVENDDYYNEYPDKYDIIINDYLTTYGN